MEILMNTQEIKLIYTWDSEPTSSYNYARNLGHELGASSWSSDLFNPYLNKLISKGILEKLYDFTEGETREGLYEFKDGTQIEFIGKSHMTYRLFYLN